MAAPSWITVLGAAALVAGVAFGGFALGQSGGGANGHPGPGVSPSATITVSGTGKVVGTPNTVSFGIGIQTKRPTATAALSYNDVRMRGLEATLKAHGVLPKGMQTSDLSIWQDTNSSGVLTGFTVSDNLNVTMSNVTQAGAAIQAAANEAGDGIQLNGITFSISDQSHLLASARARAMSNAREEAVQLARGAGASLGEVVSVKTQSTYQPVQYQGFAAMASGASVPLQRGSQPVSVQVSVTYKLK